MTIAQKTGSDPVIEPDPVRSGVCTYPSQVIRAKVTNLTTQIRIENWRETEWFTWRFHLS